MTFDLSSFITVAPGYALPLYLFWKTKRDAKIANESINKVDLLMAEIEEHKKECAKVSKDMLLQKLNDFINVTQTFQTDVKDAFKATSTKLENLNTIILTSLANQNDRRKNSE